MNIKIFAKCILAGEHTVIRGGPALVFPVRQKFLNLSWDPSSAEFSADFDGDMKDDLSIVFWGVLEKALKITGRKHSELRGQVKISSSVPVGAGLGASATLCVGLGRLFENWGYVQSDTLYEFCRELENLFHGESSGVDIAAALIGEPIQFQRPRKIESFQPIWKPKLYLSYSGQRGITAECVKTVKNIFINNKAFAEKIDEEMISAVLQMKQAFLKPESLGLIEMIESINRAHSCFSKWGLIQSALEEEIKKLRSYGALAAKPTGSGRGGYVLSLWKENPPNEIQDQLIEL